MASYIKRVGKGVLGKSISAPSFNDTLCWNEKVKSTIKINQNSYKILKNSDGVSFEKYNIAKKRLRKLFKI